MCKYNPIEMPRSVHYGSNYYVTYSIKLNRNVRLFSELEYYNYLTLEMNPDVVIFCEQPLKINIDIDGIMETSILDMWLQYKNGMEEFQEVKYTKDLEPHSKNYKRTVQQIYKQQSWCCSNNYNYAVRTEHEINSGPYYIFNLRYLQGTIKRQQIELCKRYMMDITYYINEKRKIIDIVHKKIIPSNYIFPTIALGIYEGVIDANISDKHFCYETEIWKLPTNNI